MNPAVHVRGLSKSYGRLQAVRDLDLDVEYGEIFAILGPNGAGKTTTIEILEGHRKRDSGQVRVLGEDPGDSGQKLARQYRHRAAGSQRRRDAHSVGNRANVRQMLWHSAPSRGGARTCRAGRGLPLKSRTLSGGQRRRLDVALGIIEHARNCSFSTNRRRGSIRKRRRQFWDLIRLLAGDGTTSSDHPLPRRSRSVGRPRRGHRRRQGGGSRFARELDQIRELGCDSPVEDGRRNPRGATDHPTELIRKWSADGSELAELTVSRPTLEDAYLHLIGMA